MFSEDVAQIADPDHGDAVQLIGFQRHQSGMPIRSASKQCHAIRGAIHHPYRRRKAARALRRPVQPPRGSVRMEDAVLDRQQHDQEHDDERQRRAERIEGSHAENARGSRASRAAAATVVASTSKVP